MTFSMNGVVTKKNAHMRKKAEKGEAMGRLIDADVLIESIVNRSGSES